MTDDQMAGTTAQAADGNTDAAVVANPSTETPPTPDQELETLRADNAKLKEREAQRLAEQTNREAERRELEELRAQNRNRPAEPEPGASAIADLRETILQTAAIANDPNDPYRFIAKAQLLTLQRQEQDARERAMASSLDRVPEADRPAAQDYFNKNREFFATPYHAFLAMRGERAPEESRERDNANTAEQRRSAAPAMPSSMTSGDPVPNGVMRMKRTDYYRRTEAEPNLVTLKDNGKLILTD